MLSVKDETLTYVIPRYRQRKFHYNEASYVFYRNGKYYFMWSENDTRSTEYRVRYAMGDSPTAITGLSRMPLSSAKTLTDRFTAQDIMLSSANPAQTNGTSSTTVSNVLTV